jgi:hypothetical protein
LLRRFREFFGTLAFDTVTPDLAGYEKSVTHSVPITLHAPSSFEAEGARSLFREVERAPSASKLLGAWRVMGTEWVTDFS